MRIFILEHQYFIGFANSLEELKAENQKRAYPYDYDWGKVTSKELTPDIFGVASTQSESNFRDYLRH